MTLLQLLWKSLAEGESRKLRCARNTKSSSNFTLWEEFSSKSITSVLVLRELKAPRFRSNIVILHLWLVLDFQTREQALFLWDRFLKKLQVLLQKHFSSWLHCQPKAQTCGWAEHLVVLTSAVPGQEVWKVPALGTLRVLSPVAEESRTSSIDFSCLTSQEKTNILCDQPLGMICFSLQMLSAGLCAWSWTTGAMMATSCPPYTELR